MASLKDLLAQQEELAAKIAEARVKEVEGALKKIHDLIETYDITPEEVFPSLFKRARKAEKGTRAPAKVKYQDPKNPENKWSGRGPFPPKWIQEHEAAGGSRDEFLVG